MSVTIKTSEYQFSHGKLPKGFGLWIFEGPDGKYFSKTANYGDAKKAAIEWAKENKFHTIKLGA